MGEAGGQRLCLIRRLTSTCLARYWANQMVDLQTRRWANWVAVLPKRARRLVGELCRFWVGVAKRLAPTDDDIL